MVRKLSAWLVCLSAAATCCVAHAAESPAADALFREGRKAMQRGDWSEAAQKLSESNRLEPAPGTLLNLAIAEEKLNRLAAAWEHARSAFDQLPAGDDRRDIAKNLFESIDKRVPRLVVLPAYPLPQGAAVSLDNVELRPASFGVPIPVDPGQHRITVRAHNRSPWTTTLNVTESSTFQQKVEIGPALPAPTVTPPTHTSNPWPTIGWIALGTGAVSTIVGGATGVLAIQRNRTVEDHCSPNCDPVGMDAADEGRTYSTASTVTTITGVALVAAGAVILLTKPGAPSSQTSQATSPRSPLSFSF